MYIQMYYWRIGKVQKSLSSQARQDAVSCGQDNDEEESQIRWVNPEGRSDTYLFSDRVNPAFQRDCAAHSPQKKVGSRKCAASRIEAAIVLPSQATHDVCNTKHSAGVDSHGSTALESPQKLETPNASFFHQLKESLFLFFNTQISPSTGNQALPGFGILE